MKNTIKLIFLLGVIIGLFSCGEQPVEVNAEFELSQSDKVVDTVNVVEPMKFVSKGSGEHLAVFPGDIGKDYSKKAEGDIGFAYTNGVYEYTYLMPGEYTAVTIATSYGNWSEKTITTTSSKKVVVVDKRNTISNLSIPQINGSAAIVGNTISIPVPASVFSITRLYTTFKLSSDSSKLIFNGQVVKSGDSLNFSSQPTIAVRPYNGPDKVYTVSLVSSPVSNAKSVLEYGIKATANVLKTPAVIDETNKTIRVIFAFGTKLTSVTPEFKLSTDAKAYVGATVQKTLVTKANLIAPLTFTVEALDLSRQDYVITASTDIAVKTFDITNVASSITLDYAAGTVGIAVFKNSDITKLIPAMTGIENSTVTFGDANTAFVSGVTAIDFTNPVTFTIKGKGDTAQVKTIVVTVTKV